MARKLGTRTRKKSSAASQKATTTTTELATTEGEVLPKEHEIEVLNEDNPADEVQKEEVIESSKVVQTEIVPREEQEKGEILPLTREERARFTELEAETLAALKEAQQSLLRAAQLLREIRDRELFREDYPTFEAYCEQKLGFSKRFINYQINYAKVVDNFQQWEQDVPVLPSSESQVRPLGSLKPEEQPEVWLKAVEIAEGNTPSREIVTEVVRTYRAEQKQRKQSQEKKGKKRTIEAGDCIRIKGIPTTKLSAFKNWWGFVTDVSDDGYEIELPHTTITGVKASDITLETIGEKALNKKQAQTRRKLFERLSDIYTLKTEKGEDEELLEYIFSYFVTLKPREQVNKQGKTTRSVKLTPFEEKVLGLIENEVKKG
ncbi:MAG: hypothetical protein WBM44_20345 [Waterburya sp.]